MSQNWLSKSTWPSDLCQTERMIETVSLINSITEPCLQAALSFSMCVWNYYYSSSSISLYLPASPLPAKPDLSLSHELSLPHSLTKHVLITWTKMSKKSRKLLSEWFLFRGLLCLVKVMLSLKSLICFTQSRHEGIKVKLQAGGGNEQEKKGASMIRDISESVLQGCEV